MIDHPLAGFEAAVHQLAGGGFERVDLVGGETIIPTFVPVGGAVVERVKTQPDTFDRGLPVAAGFEGKTLHGLG